MPALYERLLLSAQNANMKAGVIGGSIGGVDKLAAVLEDFDSAAVISKYGGDCEAMLDEIVATLKPRGQIRRTPRSIWPRYCQTISSGAAFFDQFDSAQDFFQWADFFDRDDRARASLAMLLSREIAGFGFALSCDFLKEIGYVNFPKPDVHLRDIFKALRLCDDQADDYQLFKAIIRLANNANVSPYHADKVFWLVGSGYFYRDENIGSEGRIGSKKQDFIEFKPPGSFSPVVDMVGGGPFCLEPGQWTDDTSMALCLADSLVACRGFDARDQMERYVRWRDEGYLSSNGICFDIGTTVSRALGRFLRTGDPFAGSVSPNAAGNGSLMRLAPAPLFFASNPEQAVQMSAESSRTTHGAATCLDACRYFGGLIVGAVQGASKEELLSSQYTPVDGLWSHMPLCAEIFDIASGSFKRKEPPDIVGSGYVVKSLEAALWAFHKSSTFEAGVNLGNDADTTAAIYGQIAGAYYGLEGIPASWRERISHAGLIAELARGLYASRTDSAGRSLE